MTVEPFDVYDMTIIGAGPTGLFAAFYAAGMRGMRTKVIEALETYGGQLTTLYPDKFIYDVAGFPKVLAKDLAKFLYEQAAAYKPTMLFSEKVLDLKKLDGGIIELVTDRGVHFSRTVLIAAGHGAFTPRKLGNPSVERFENKGVYYTVKDRWQFKDKRIMIVGGGDSAVDWALNLKDLARETYLVHRRMEFRAHEGSVIELFHSPVKVLVPYEVKSAEGGEKLERVTVFNNKTNEEITLEIDALILQLGHLVDVSLFKKWGLEMEGNFIKINARCETNIPGVYAAGDIASQPDSVKLALLVVGFAQAAVAVNVAKTYIDPRASYFPGHSSERRM